MLSNQYELRKDKDLCLQYVLYHINNSWPILTFYAYFVSKRVTRTRKKKKRLIYQNNSTWKPRRFRCECREDVVSLPFPEDDLIFRSKVPPQAIYFFNQKKRGRNLSKHMNLGKHKANCILQGFHWMTSFLNQHWDAEVIQSTDCLQPLGDWSSSCFRATNGAE